MVWAALAAAAALALIFLTLRRQRGRKTVLVGRLRTSGMYAGVAGLLRQMDSELVESVVLRPQDISIRLLDGQSTCYDYRQHNADPLSPEALSVMADAVLIDMPRLQDERYYRRSVPARRSNDPVYAYTMRHQRKDYLLRAMNQ